MTRTTPKFLAAAAVLGVCLQLHAADRWEALSLVESGDNDRAVGPGGEVSRYQMKPETWRRYASTNADWSNPQDALVVAKAIMQERCAVFESSTHRPPTDFEFYVLWNAPAQVLRPGRTVSSRAERFCNLIRSTPAVPPDPGGQTKPAQPASAR